MSKRFCGNCEHFYYPRRSKVSHDYRFRSVKDGMCGVRHIPVFTGNCLEEHWPCDHWKAKGEK